MITPVTSAPFQTLDDPTPPASATINFLNLTPTDAAKTLLPPPASPPPATTTTINNATTLPSPPTTTSTTSHLDLLLLQDAPVPFMVTDLPSDWMMQPPFITANPPSVDTDCRCGQEGALPASSSSSLRCCGALGEPSGVGVRAIPPLSYDVRQWYGGAQGSTASFTVGLPFHSPLPRASFLL
ncbi:hypothetical protein HDU67_009045 [Dinochytrium kinnereticum]|nr:hypothetical protein HDU67_009045 [Dinochytrium kinnereticum]